MDDGNDTNVLHLQLVKDVVMVWSKLENSVIYEIEMVFLDDDVTNFVK